MSAMGQSWSLRHHGSNVRLWPKLDSEMFQRIRSARLDSIIRELRSVPARAIFDKQKGGELAHGDEVAQCRSLAEIINSELDELEGTRPRIDEPEL